MSSLLLREGGEVTSNKSAKSKDLSTFLNSNCIVTELLLRVVSFYVLIGIIFMEKSMSVESN